jgi:hypothetical protein
MRPIRPDSMDDTRGFTLQPARWVYICLSQGCSREGQPTLSGRYRMEWIDVNMSCVFTVGSSSPQRRLASPYAIDPVSQAQDAQQSQTLLRPPQAPVPEASERRYRGWWSRIRTAPPLTWLPLTPAIREDCRYGPGTEPLLISTKPYHT